MNSPPTVRACIIFNPTARGDKARRLRGLLDALATEYVLRPTTGPATAPGIARAAVEDGFDTLIAAGGDGTVNEVVNGMANTPDGLARCRLGVIPLGTVNVFARELGLLRPPEAAWAVIRSEIEMRFDLPWVEWDGERGRERRWFVQLAGAGLDAMAVAGVDWSLKKKIGPAAYVWSGIRALRQPQPQITVAADGREFTGQFVLTGNGRHYGYFRVFPRADLRDGALDVRLISRIGWGKLFRLTWNWLTRQEEAPTDEVWLRTPRFELRADRPVPFELDGEHIGWLPATLGVETGALRVIVPERGS